MCGNVNLPTSVLTDDIIRYWNDDSMAQSHFINREETHCDAV